MRDELERYIDLFCSMLNSDNLKCTSTRQNILRVFFLNKHLDVEEILKFLKENLQVNTTKQTVYATIKLLISYNIISKRINDDRSFYELTRSRDHYHMVCSQCNKYIEFNDQNLTKLASKLAANEQFDVSSFDITIYGLCQECIDN